jgi:serine phosphatase RsbU (regulator of sigma subunit)
LKENAGKSVKEIVEVFLSAGEEWRETRPQDDDTTFIVIKKL